MSAAHDDRPTWALLLEAAENLAARGSVPFTRLQLIEEVRRQDPARERSTLDPIIQGMTDNASGGPRSACGQVFHRVDRGLYVLASPTGEYPRQRQPSQRPASTPRRRSGRRSRVEARLATLTAQFDDFVDRYDSAFPFTRSGQYESHRATIYLRRQHSSIDDALADDRFLDLLYATLRSWGIGKRASRLMPVDDFAAALREARASIAALDGLALEDLDGDASEIGQSIWTVIDRVRVVDNIALIVAGSKTLHHLLPDLVPPMDRAWTGRFFEWNPAELQTSQRATFTSAFVDLATVALQVQPSRLVGRGWRTSQSKVVDNAVVAFTM